MTDIFMNRELKPLQ